LWFGTRGNGGISRYDGKTWSTFTTNEGLAGNQIGELFQDRDGVLWFGTLGGGVSRYDGKTFTNFTIEDGLCGDYVSSIIQDPEGHFWFGTENGVSRYDGQTFTPKDGLADGRVGPSFQDQDGNLWFGTYYNSDGITRFDGQTWTTFTTQDGLATNSVASILQDRNGDLWFAGRGGVSRYDGQVFQTLTIRDGLRGDYVRHVFEDRSGNIWFSTTRGVTRFRPPSAAPPAISIDAVVSGRRYTGIVEVSMPVSAGLTVLEFHAMSIKTRPEAMVYRYRLKGYDDGWTNTRERRVEYQDLPRGDYTFEVIAVDRDLVYSEDPATLVLTVHLPYERIGLWSALCIAVLLIGWQTVRVVRRDRRLKESHTAMSDANKELFQANLALQRDSAVERIRGEVQAMEQASDFERVLSLLPEDLKAVGLSFDTCEIDVLDEPINEPTMAYFENHGLRYTTYTINPNGTVADELYHNPAPFPRVVRERLSASLKAKPGRAAVSKPPLWRFPPQATVGFV